MYESYKNLDKDFIYIYYTRIVDKPKSCDKVTIKKMIEEILNQYSNKDFLYYICTSKELKFLDNILNNKIDEDDYSKYFFEIKTLNNKFIFDADNFCIFDEQVQNVKEAVNLYLKKGAFSDYYICAVGVLRLLGFMPLDVFKELNFLGDKKLSQEEIDESFRNYISNPLFKYYSCIYTNENDEKYICYDSYFEIIDELEENRKNYENLESVETSKDNLHDIFYYGFPIRNKSVKKMYDFVIEYIPYLMDYVEEARVLYDYSVVERFLSDDKAIDIITTGLNLCPSCALYGMSPNEYINGLHKRKELNSKMDNDF